MKIETYEKGAVPGAELCCGTCASPLKEIDDNKYFCFECEDIIEQDFGYLDPPTKGINFGYTRPDEVQITSAKVLFTETFSTDWNRDERFVIVESADGQFRLYEINHG